MGYVPFPFADAASHGLHRLRQQVASWYSHLSQGSLCREKLCLIQNVLCAALLPSACGGQGPVPHWAAKPGHTEAQDRETSRLQGYLGGARSLLEEGLSMSCVLHNVATAASLESPGTSLLVGQLGLRGWC